MKLLKKIQWRFKLYRNQFFFRLLKIKERDSSSIDLINLNFNNYSISGANPYWLNFKEINFTHIQPVTLHDGSIISKGIILDNKGLLHLESTVFQNEYLNLLKANHVIYLRKCYKKECIDKLVIPLAFYLDWNYYHWLMEAILRLSIIDKETLKEATIILNQPVLNFQRESLKFLFNITDEQIKCQQKKVLTAKEVLLLPFQHIRNNQTQQTNLYNPKTIQSLNSIASKKISKPNTKKKFIISRETASERRIANIHLLKDKFPEFEIVRLEEKSFEEQVNLFQNAEIIIAAHGAGLTNLLWANPKLKLIELFPDDRLIRDAFYFFQISSALKVKHMVLTYNSINEFQDCLIDSELLTKLNKVIFE